MKRLILIASMAALGACQTSTASYEAASGPGQVGYFSAPVEDNRVAVSYTGKKGMSEAQVARLRADLLHLIGNIDHMAAPSGPCAAEAPHSRPPHARAHQETT